MFFCFSCFKDCPCEVDSSAVLFVDEGDVSPTETEKSPNFSPEQHFFSKAFPYPLTLFIARGARQ